MLKLYGGFIICSFNNTEYSTYLHTEKGSLDRTDIATSYGTDICTTNYARGIKIRDKAQQQFAQLMISPHEKFCTEYALNEVSRDFWKLEFLKPIWQTIGSQRSIYSLLIGRK